MILGFFWRKQTKGPKKTKQTQNHKREFMPSVKDKVYMQSIQ